MARVTLAKLVYGAAFALVLPALLILWAASARANVAMPVFGSAAVGWGFAFAGVVLMLSAMRDLWRLGGGLPMNAFPPPRLVKQGTFRFIPHPIYTSFVIACLGLSISTRSPAGLWLVTPVAALGCTALVWGYEHGDLLRRFGATLHILPADEDTRPSTFDRVHFYLCAVIPWIALYEITIHSPVPGIAFRLPFEDGLPIWPETAIVYQSIYVAVAAAPWFARSRRDLRRLMISVWVASAVVFPFYWVLPSTAPRRPMAGDHWIARVLRFERDTYPPLAAFPSFHALWAVFLARLWRPRWVGIAYAAAISLSCITTGMHYIADIAAGLVLAPLFLYPESVWRGVLRLAARLANSWREWRVGPVRLINYGVYSGLAAFVQAGVVVSAAGPGHTLPALATLCAGLVGAALWAQWVEGSARLRRPFGFYGGLIAVALACLCFPERWILLGAHCLAAPWLQALGRLRCMVNGCCHGAPAPAAAGIVVTNPRSRVTRLAALGGVPIHPTQLYSIVGNLMLGPLLLRLWISGASLALICGIYAIGNGLARFVEETYRGEPQTLRIAGLRLYQWIAAASVAVGAAVTTLPAPPPPAWHPTPAGLAWAALFGLLAAIATGVDFPESDRPFARLA